MSQAQGALSTSYLFGLNGDINDNVFCIEDSLVVYPAANNIVIYQSEQKVQRFIPATADSRGVTALAVTGNRKYLAVAEQNPDDALITVYDLHTLKKRKGLQTRQVGSQEYVSLAFSPDNKFLAAMGGSPEWLLVLWLWEKSKVASTVKVSGENNAPVYQVLFNPVDNTVLSVVGDHILRGFRLVDATLKNLAPYLGKSRQPGNCTCHCWITDTSDRERIIVATDQGELLFVENGEYRLTLDSPDEGKSIGCIVQYTKGFIVGGEDGRVTFYEKNEDGTSFRRGRSFIIPDNPVLVRAIALTTTEETMVVTLANNQVFTFLLAQANYTAEKPNEAMGGVGGKGPGAPRDDPNEPSRNAFDPMGHSFHCSAITGLDTCIRKPILATCSTDKSVRIWNAHDNSCEAAKFFPEEAYSVSLHPSGLHVLVGFADKLRAMHLLDNDIRPYAEFPIKSCIECRFSNGGHYFAAVNSNTIQIYSTYTCENVGNLRGHNGKVRSLFWSADDLLLVSAGMDGAVYEWSTQEFKRVGENVLKGCSYTCVLSTQPTTEDKERRIFAVGSDQKLKMFTQNYAQSDEIDTKGASLTTICLSQNQKLMFAGTETGAIRMYKPNMGSGKFPFSENFQELQAHVKPVSRIMLCNEDNLLFSVSEDGCISIISIKDPEMKKEGKKEGANAAPMYGEEVLCSKSELEERKSELEELQTQVKELESQNEHKLQLKDNENNLRLKNMAEEFRLEMESELSKFKDLMEAKAETEAEYEERLSHVHIEQQNMLSQLESTFQRKIVAEVERYHALQLEKDNLNMRWDEQNSVLMDTHERVITELTEEYEEKLSEGGVRLERLKVERAEQLREFEETKFQLEEDADREIESQKEKYETRLAVERDIGLRLKGENGIMKKKFNALQRDIDANKEDIKVLEKTIANKDETIASLEKDIGSLRKEIAERDETIGDKERRIYDMKKKTQDLEKFKFVLEYKIKELNRQIEPRKEDIERMNGQIAAMDEELERYHKHTAILERTIDDLKQRIETDRAEALTSTMARQDMSTHLHRLNHDLNEVSKHLQDPQQLKDAVKELLVKYHSDDIQIKDMTVEVQEEYKKQREYLERSVNGLKKKLKKDMSTHKLDNQRIIHDNMELLKEINELRRDLKMAQNEKEEMKLLVKNPQRHMPVVSKISTGRKPGSLGSPKTTTPYLSRPTTQQFASQRWGDVRSPPNAHRPFTGAPSTERWDDEKDLEIVRLNTIIADLQGKLMKTEVVHTQRPPSGGRLPPMQGFQDKEQ